MREMLELYFIHISHQVRNGDGPFSPQMGLFCGSTAPSDMFSSGSRLWVKFFTDSDISSTGKRLQMYGLLCVIKPFSAGFSAVFTAEDPVCGSLVPLNVTNSTQVCGIKVLVFG